MKKVISRMLALLLVLLLSGIPSAMAEVIELGTMSEAEELLYQAVLDVFPTATVEQQYLYAKYYEDKGKTAAVDSLMETLTSEQIVSLTNYKAENACVCEEGCGGAESCECLCHTVDAFNSKMEILIAAVDTLLKEGMDAARDYIIQLRYKEIILNMMANGQIPDQPLYADKDYNEYVPPFYDEYLQMQSQVMLAADIDGENEDPALKALNKLNSLEADAENVDTDSSTAQAVNEVITINAEAASTFRMAYGRNADYSAAVSATDAETGNTLQELIKLLDVDADQLKNYVETEAEIGKFTGKIADDSNVSYTMYNFSKGAGKDGYYFTAGSAKFDSKDTDDKVTHGVEYDTILDVYDESTGTIVTNSIANAEHGSGNNPSVGSVLGPNGYPVITTEGITEPTEMDFLFNGTTGVTRYPTVTGAGLFRDKGNGYFEYSSYENAAYYNTGTKKFTLYDGIVFPLPYRNPSAEEGYTKGNFLPFNDLSGLGTVGQMNGNPYYQSTDPKLYYLNTVPAKRDDQYNVETSSSNMIDLWFGMIIEFSFYMPKDGKINGEDMVFNFTGDDDVWVFIDDALILDIGGAHMPRTGKINFATGDVEYQSPANSGAKVESTIKEMVAKAREADPDDERYAESVLKGDTYEDYTPHTFKFFYLERAAGRSICQLKFNIPQLPRGGLTVVKEIDGTLTEATDKEYTFKIYDKSGRSMKQEELTYTTTYNNVTSDKKTASGGVFTLRPGETASFEKLESKHTYTVTETQDTLTESTSWSITDLSDDTSATGSGSSADVYIDPEQTSAAFIVSKNTLHTTDLTIIKAVEKARLKDANREYSFEATIKTLGGKVFKPAAGTGYTVDASTGKVSFNLKAGESVILPDLPVGADVVVTEVSAGNVPLTEFGTVITSTNLTEDTDNSEYSYTGKTQLGDGTLTFTNTPRCFPLKITKNYNSNLDLDSDETQSAMFEITNDDDTSFSLIVAINGTGSVTVNDLPAGNYTVTELTDWTWRYTSTSNRVDNKVYVDGDAKGDGVGDDDEITFTNTRQQPYWLSGDSYAENTFADASEANSKTVTAIKSPAEN